MISNYLPTELDNDLFLSRMFVLRLNMEGNKFPPLDLKRLAFNLWIGTVEFMILHFSSEAVTNQAREEILASVEFWGLKSMRRALRDRFFFDIEDLREAFFGATPQSGQVLSPVLLPMIFNILWFYPGLDLRTPDWC